MEKKSRYVTLRYDDSENDYIDKIIEYIKTKEDLIVNFFELEDKIKNIYVKLMLTFIRLKMIFQTGLLVKAEMKMVLF